jgi:L-lactate dehydrogenase complex protein LldG
MADNSIAKEDILSSIRQNLAASKPFDAVYYEHHKPVVSTTIGTRQNVGIADLTLRFKENVELVGAKCSVARTEFEGAAIIQNIITEQEPHRLAISNSALVKRLFSSVKTEAEILVEAGKNDLFDCDIGITGAQMAIAETGTLVLESESERNRLISLLPPVHICVLKAKNIHATMGGILAPLRKNLSRTVTFITGQSRTSDIELTLALGVHGPRELHVIVIDDETNA